MSPDSPVVSEDDAEQEWREILAASGRVTVPRVLCLEVLHRADRHLSAREILDQVSREFPSIKLSTIYRTMAWFLEIGLAHRVDSPQGSHFGAGAAHAHTLCIGCGQIVDVPDVDPATFRLPGLPRISESPVSGLTIQITCATCSKASNSRPR